MAEARQGWNEAAEAVARAALTLDEPALLALAEHWAAVATDSEVRLSADGPAAGEGGATLSVEVPVRLHLRTAGSLEGAGAFLTIVATALYAGSQRERAAEAEMFFREVITPMPIAVMVRRGPQMRVTHSNPAAEAILSRPVPSGTARDLHDIAAAGIYRLYDEVMRSGELRTVRDLRAMIEPPNGAPTERFAHVTVMPLRAADGTVDGTALFAVDTTEQVLARRGAEASEQRQRQLLESIQAIVWEAPHGEGQWSYVSEAAVSMLGYPRARWFEPGFWRTILHSEDRVRVVRDSGSAHGDHEIEYRVFHASGRVIWLHDTVRVIRDAAGRIVALRGVMLDVSLRREAEEARARLQADMVELQKAESLGVMAGGIAHDFNNLLTVILGNASLALMRLPERSPARTAIEDLITNAQRAADLTRQLLAYSGRAQLTTELVDLGHLVRELRGLIAAALPKSATLEIETGPLVPAVEGDTTQLQQVVMNLATNAAEALGNLAGRVRVETGFVHLAGEQAEALSAPPGAYVRLTVRDDGVGMSTATKKRVFDPFFTTKAQGRGLGLAAVQGIVKGHRGVIDIATREEVGTSVSVYLPATSRPGEQKAAAAGTIRPGTGLILIIDDESEVRATARAMLEALGYEVIEAEDGRVGLVMFDRHRSLVRAVLLDMTMPVMSGEEVYRELRKRAKDTPIVLSSGYSAVDARRRGMTEGIAGFLQKPYTVRQLSEMMARATESKA